MQFTNWINEKLSCHKNIKGNLSSIIFVLYPPPEEVGHCSLSPDCVKLKTSSACRQRVFIHIPSNSFHFNFSPDVVSRWHNTNDFYAKKKFVICAAWNNCRFPLPEFCWMLKLELWTTHRKATPNLFSVECWSSWNPIWRKLIILIKAIPTRATKLSFFYPNAENNFAPWNTIHTYYI